MTLQKKAPVDDLTQQANARCGGGVPRPGQSPGPSSDPAERPGLREATGRQAPHVNPTFSAAARSWQQSV